MNINVNARLSLALPLVLAVLMAFSVAFAQDEEGDTTENDNTAQDNTESAEPAGVGDIAQAADNFNVPAVPTPADEDRAVLALAGRLFHSPEDLMNPQIQRRFQNEKMNLSLQRTVNQNIERVKRLMGSGGSNPKRMLPGQTALGDILAQVTDDSSGDVMTVFMDYSVVMADTRGETFFEGSIAGESAESLMILGQDTDGNQYAISNGDVIGLTTTNDVFLGSGDHLYYYDYDEDGNFVSLTDSDENEYDVEVDEDGSIYILDADGNEGDFYADGSFELYDEDGNFLDEGALFGDDDGDDLEADSDEGDSDFSDDGGDAEAGDDSGDFSDDGGDAEVGDDGSDTEASDDSGDFSDDGGDDGAEDESGGDGGDEEGGDDSSDDGG